MAGLTQAVTGRRLVAVLIGGALLLWVTMGVTLTTTLSIAASDTVLRVWPWSAAAAARKAAGLLIAQDVTAQQRTEAEAYARQALALEPGNVTAVRSLAIVTSSRGEQDRAARLLSYAESLSRRDLLTQTLLIETKVAAGDIRGALTHYDRALRTTLEARELLIPILASAASDPVIARELARTVARRPAWWPELARAVANQGSSPRAISTVLRPLRLRASEPAEAEVLSIALRRVVDLGAPTAAYAWYRELTGAVTTLRNPGFEGESRLAPFEWQLASDEALSSLREPRDGATGNFALSLTGNTAGEVARQLIAASPGRYRLSALFGAVPEAPSARPKLAMACWGGTVGLATLTPRAAGRQRAAAEVTIPAGCRFQWLFVNTGAAVDLGGDSPWIDDVALVKASGS